jgi:hypothetical protein
MFQDIKLRCREQALWLTYQDGIRFDVSILPEPPSDQNPVEVAQVTKKTHVRPGRCLDMLGRTPTEAEFTTASNKRFTASKLLKNNAKVQFESNSQLKSRYYTSKTAYRRCL